MGNLEEKYLELRNQYLRFKEPETRLELNNIAQTLLDSKIKAFVNYGLTVYVKKW